MGKWKKRILFAFCFWGAIAFSSLFVLFLLVQTIFAYPLLPIPERFLTDKEFLEIVISFIQLIYVALFWGVVMYFDGYNSKHPFGKEEWLIHLIAFSVNIIGGAFLKYAAYTSGGAYWMTGFVWLQTGHEWEGVGTAPLWLHAAFTLLFDAVYLLAGWLAFNWGRRKRASDREKLMHESEIGQEKR